MDYEELKRAVESVGLVSSWFEDDAIATDLDGRSYWLRNPELNEGENCLMYMPTDVGYKMN